MTLECTFQVQAVLILITYIVCSGCVDLVNMEDLFRPNHLLIAELDYELKIRAVFSQRNKDEKRKILTRLLEKERDRAGSQIDLSRLSDQDFNFGVEQTAINVTIDSIKQLLADFEGTTTDTLFLRLKSRIAHVMGRVKRIPIVDQADASYPLQLDYQNETVATCLYLEAELVEKARANQNESSQTNDNLNNTNHTVITIPTVTCQAKSEPVSRWGIKFNGNPKQLFSFLERISDLAKSRGIDNDQLFKSAVELFSDDAFIWFRGAQSRINSWEELVLNLKADFLPSDIEDQIWEEIRLRKQKKSEKVTIFVAHLLNLFGRLNNISEFTKLKYVKKNLLPEYKCHVALQVVNSMEELLKVLKKLEEAGIVKNKIPSEQLFETKESYPNKKYDRKRPSGKSPTKPTFPKPAIDVPSTSGNPTQNKSTKPVIICWNCKGPNHVYSRCLLARRLFCYKCGKSDVKASDCACSKN